MVRVADTKWVRKGLIKMLALAISTALQNAEMGLIY